MRSWQRAVLGAMLLAAVAVAGIAVNFALLRLTQDANDPVGKLSPRAVFVARNDTGPPVTTAGDDGSSGGDHEPHDGDD